MLEEKYGSKEMIEVIAITAVALLALINYIFLHGTWHCVEQAEWYLHL